MNTLNYLVLHEAPALDPEWLRHEEEANLKAPKAYISPLDRQPVYAEQCRQLSASMLAPGAPSHHLSRISTQRLQKPSSLDSFQIPIVRFFDAQHSDQADVIVVYFHGGGLHVGEADSEELSCRRVVHDVPGATVYSVGYRLMPAFPASTCVADSLDAFAHVRTLHPAARLVIVGSSSGGQLAASVSQAVPSGSFQGVVLRCPVTSDGGSSLDFVPETFRGAYTSSTKQFETSLLGVLRRDLPRDGLERMPLEIDSDHLKQLRMPRTWVQVCTNDTLYSDGVSYSMLLREAGVDVEVDVRKGWPHTFWLKAPHLDGAEEAEKQFVKGLNWVLAASEKV